MVYTVKDKEDFDAKVGEAGDKLVVIDFYATWCGPCKRIAPFLEELSKENSDVMFLKVDVDECEDIAQEYNVTAMPTFVFLKGGKKLTDFAGASEEKLKQEILARK